MTGILKKICFSCNVKVGSDANSSCSVFDKIDNIGKISPYVS
jgi:hypothetical protein